MGAKKTGSPKSRDISATRLSHGDPIGFPPHPRGWFSIIVYHYLIYTAFQHEKPVGINVRLSRRYKWVVMGHLLALINRISALTKLYSARKAQNITSNLLIRILNTKMPGLRIVCAIFRRPGCLVETL